MVAKPKHYWTPQEYLTMERASTERHEYIDGEVFDMVGASREHNRIAGSAYASLYAQLRDQPCDIFMNDMRVKIPQAKQYTYPDIVVVCGEGNYEDKEVDTLVNPTLIIEVLSPSTERHDRGKKFQDYQTLESLQSYVLIAQVRPFVEHFARQPDGAWRYTAAEGLDASLELPAIGCLLRLVEVYEKVKFDDDSTSSQERM